MNGCSPEKENILYHNYYKLHTYLQNNIAFSRKGNGWEWCLKFEQFENLFHLCGQCLVTPCLGNSVGNWYEHLLGLIV